MGMVQSISINDVIQFKHHHCIIDARSEAEYNHAHIPKALNLPILNNEERKLVGTAYKQKSREEAIKLGLSFFGPKLNALIAQVEDWSKTYNTKTFIIYCWRGGLRSATLAWLLNMYGFTVYTISGGYKSFRKWSLQVFKQPFSFWVLGGFTGSNKTEILKEFAKKGEAVIDLESLASHRGSTFGQLGMPSQPSNEQFENDLAFQLFNYKEAPVIWVESESPRIGTISLPISFFEQLRLAKYIQLQIPFEERLKLIVEQYGVFPKLELEAGILRLQKRLGGLATKEAIIYLNNNDLYNCFSILLVYYDKYYAKGNSHYHKAQQFSIQLDTINPIANANYILEWKKQHLAQ